MCYCQYNFEYGCVVGSKRSCIIDLVCHTDVNTVLRVSCQILLLLKKRVLFCSLLSTFVVVESQITRSSRFAMTSFNRPVGAQADLNELEYISALHQTCQPRLRSNGTVSALDIARFLKSRYGIVATDGSIQELVRGLGGGPISEEEEELKQTLLDLVQLTTIVIMPTIARAAHDWRVKKDNVINESLRVDASIMSSSYELSAPMSAPSDSNYDDEFTRHNFWTSKEKREEEKESNYWRYALRPMPRNMFQHVLRMLVNPLVEEEEHTGETKYAKDEKGDFLLTADFVKALLLAHGEDVRAADSDMIESMLKRADGSTALDEETWVRLLSSDLDRWEVGSEDNPQTTEFFDVFHYESHYKVTEKGPPGEDGHTCQNDDGQDQEQGTQETKVVEGIQPVKQVQMASYIDFAVDNQRSVAFVVFAWVFYVTTSLTYISLLATQPALYRTCDPNFGCTTLEKVWAWTILALFMSLAGLIMLVPISIGNGGVSQSWKVSLGSLVLITAWTGTFYTLYRLTRSGQFGAEWVQEQTASATFAVTADICLYSGCILLLVQIKQFIGTIIPPQRISDSVLLSKWFIPSFVRGAARSKRAATRKVNR